MEWLAGLRPVCLKRQAREESVSVSSAVPVPTTTLHAACTHPGRMAGQRRLSPALPAPLQPPLQRVATAWQRGCCSTSQSSSAASQAPAGCTAGRTGSTLCEPMHGTGATRHQQQREGETGEARGSTCGGCRPPIRTSPDSVRTLRRSRMLAIVASKAIALCCASVTTNRHRASAGLPSFCRTHITMVRWLGGGDGKQGRLGTLTLQPWSKQASTAEHSSTAATLVPSNSPLVIARAAEVAPCTASRSRSTNASCSLATTVRAQEGSQSHMDGNAHNMVTTMKRSQVWRKPSWCRHAV